MCTPSKTRPALNGVDTPTLFATLDAVKANPEWSRPDHARERRAGRPGTPPASI